MTFQRARSEGCVSDLLIDRLIANEPVDADAALHARTCPACAARVAAIRGEARRFDEPLPGRPRRRRWWPVAATAAAAAAAVLFFVVPRGDDRGVRKKGGDRLGFFVKRGAAVLRGADGDTVFPGDTVRFTAAVDRPAYVAVVSVDSALHRSVYVPPTRVPAGEPVPLPAATLLDGQLGHERFIGLFCAAPPDPVALAGEAIPPGCTVDVLTIEKVAP